MRFVGKFAGGGVAARATNVFRMILSRPDFQLQVLNRKCAEGARLPLFALTSLAASHACDPVDYHGIQLYGITENEIGVLLGHMGIGFTIWKVDEGIYEGGGRTEMDAIEAEYRFCQIGRDGVAIGYLSGDLGKGVKAKEGEFFSSGILRVGADSATFATQLRTTECPSQYLGGLMPSTGKAAIQRIRAISESSRLLMWGFQVYQQSPEMLQMRLVNVGGVANFEKKIDNVVDSLHGLVWECKNAVMLSKLRRELVDIAEVVAIVQSTPVGDRLKRAQKSASE
jgi:hypothetical protein